MHVADLSRNISRKSQHYWRPYGLMKQKRSRNTFLLKSQRMSDCSAFGHREQLITYCFTREFVTRFCKHIAPHCQIANLRIPAKTDTPLWVSQIFHSGQCFCLKGCHGKGLQAWVPRIPEPGGPGVTTSGSLRYRYQPQESILESIHRSHQPDFRGPSQFPPADVGRTTFRRGPSRT